MDLPILAVIDAEMENVNRLVFFRQITPLEGVRRRAALVVILSDAGIVPDEPKEAK
jgi:hypothetical protein